MRHGPMHILSLSFTHPCVRRREDGVVQNCKGVFSLLRKHVCSLPRQSQTVLPITGDANATNGNAVTSKRKSTGQSHDGTVTKRLRGAEADAMEVDGVSLLCCSQFKTT